MFVVTRSFTPVDDLQTTYIYIYIYIGQMTCIYIDQIVYSWIINAEIHCCYAHSCPTACTSSSTLPERSISFKMDKPWSTLRAHGSKTIYMNQIERLFSVQSRYWSNFQFADPLNISHCPLTKEYWRGVWRQTRKPRNQLPI